MSREKGMDYKYKILQVNESERWITIISDDEFDMEETDAFIYFVKMIQKDVNGKIEDVGDIRYRIAGDGMGLVYQWDDLFGITVTYPENVTKVQAIKFLSKYMSEPYTIRSLRKEEVFLLKDFLYEAIFIPEGTNPPAVDIVERPELRVYTDGFGTRKGDHCLVAEIGGRVVGAVWTRIMNDYGHVDDDTPSFAISLYKEYRGRGIGTEMMKRMLDLLKAQGYRKASLSVQKANDAVKMYRKTGFKIVKEKEEEYIMVCRLND